MAKYIAVYFFISIQMSTNYTESTALSCVYTTPYGVAAQLYTREQKAHECATPSFVDNLWATKDTRRLAIALLWSTRYRGEQYSSAARESTNRDAPEPALFHAYFMASMRKGW